MEALSRSPDLSQSNTPRSDRAEGSTSSRLPQPLSDFDQGGGVQYEGDGVLATSGTPGELTGGGGSSSAGKDAILCTHLILEMFSVSFHPAAKLPLGLSMLWFIKRPFVLHISGHCRLTISWSTEECQAWSKKGWSLRLRPGF